MGYAGTRRSRWPFVVGAFVVAFLVVVAVAQITRDDNSITTVDAGATDAAGRPEHPVVRRQPGDPMSIGSADAPVVLVEWTDLRCPFCAVFYRETLPTLITEYVATGTLRIEFHDVAFFGEQSENAAIAARAAGEQGRFNEFLTVVYGAAPEGKQADIPRERLLEFAERAGVADLARFQRDLDSPILRAAASQSTFDAQQLGVNSVPFFLVGETAFSGAQPIDVFRQMLDQAIASTE